MQGEDNFQDAKQSWTCGKLILTLFLLQKSLHNCKQFINSWEKCNKEEEFFFGLNHFYIHLPLLLMMIIVVYITFYCNPMVFARDVLLHLMWLLPLVNILTTHFALPNYAKMIINVVYARSFFILINVLPKE